MAKGRTKDTFIKDLTYDKFYVIIFKLRNLTYVYCKPEGKHYTFKPLEIQHSENLKSLNIQKYPSEIVANSVLKKIPLSDVNGIEVYPEIVHNTYIAELL
jgi:hypothetical protein